MARSSTIWGCLQLFESNWSSNFSIILLCIFDTSLLVGHLHNLFTRKPERNQVHDQTRGFMDKSGWVRLKKWWG
jgi:hypothetical protein